MNKVCLWSVSVGLFFTSCEKILIKKSPSDNPEKIFEVIWKDIDENYSYFIYKKINWDSVRVVYEPKVHAEMSEKELFEVLESMLALLRDGHVNLVAPHDQTHYDEIYLNSPPNFNWDIVERTYFNGNPAISMGGTFYYTIFDSVKIGYIYIPSFDRSYYSFINQILEYMGKAKGIIIDIRNNGGGETIHAETVASAFNNEKKIYAYWQWKKGPAHDDFTEKIPYYLNVSQRYAGPIVLITNRKTFSTANDFTLMMRSIPSVVHIGDTTGGGGGVPYYRELPNGWYYRFSRTLTYDASGQHVEFGIAPHITLSYDTSLFLQGRDAYIDYAINLLK